MRDRSRLEHECTMGTGERLVRVLLDQKDRRALLVDLRDDLEDLLDELRRETHRRLVKQQEARLRHQRPADREHLLLTTGHRAALLGPPFRETRKQRKHPVEVRGHGAAVFAAEGSHVEILHHGHAGEDPATFRRLRNTASHPDVRLHLRDVVALEGDRSAVRIEQPGNRLHRGGLARTVGTDERNDLALLHGEGHIVDRFDASIADAYILQFKQRHLQAPRGRRQRRAGRFGCRPAGHRQASCRTRELRCDP